MFDKKELISKATIYSQRQFGEPKLSKPKELKGIKQSFTVDWIVGKCKCQCFILGNDLWVKHRDFNSIEVYGHNYEFRKKFIYNDSFGCVVLRGEAWLVVENLLIDLENKVFPVKIWEGLTEQVTGEYGCGQWERFFERIIKTLKEKRYEKRN